MTNIQCSTRQTHSVESDSNITLNTTETQYRTWHEHSAKYDRRIAPKLIEIWCRAKQKYRAQYDTSIVQNWQKDSVENDRCRLHNTTECLINWPIINSYCVYWILNWDGYKGCVVEKPPLLRQERQPAHIAGTQTEGCSHPHSAFCTFLSVAVAIRTPHSVLSYQSP